MQMSREPIFSKNFNFKLFYYGINLFNRYFKGGLPKLELFISFLKNGFLLSNSIISPFFAIS